jgi:hypothetical protein
MAKRIPPVKVRDKRHVAGFYVAELPANGGIRLQLLRIFFLALGKIVLFFFPLLVCFNQLLQLPLTNRAFASRPDTSRYVFPGARTHERP